MKVKLKSVSVDELLFRRPGITKIVFTADYGSIKRRGVVQYDTIDKKFLTHNDAIELLANICLELGEPRKAQR